MLFKRSKPKTGNYHSWFAWLEEKEKQQALRLSKFLQEKTSSLSKRSLKIAVGLFFAIMIAIDTTIIVMALHQHGGFLPFDPIQMPAHIVMPPAPEGIRGPGRSRDVQYLDSLLKIPEERKAYDSLLRLRPGLADTILQLQNLNR